jgi:antagonist of KipI
MLRVIDPGPFTTIQDLGRFGYGRFGVPASGAMDSFALRAANLLVGNAVTEAGLEIGLGDSILEATEDRVVAAAGAGYDLWVQGRPMPFWVATLVRRGWLIEMRKRSGGQWGYLAVGGGIQCPVGLGSRATYVRGNLGGLNGGPLRGGDSLPVGASSRWLWELAGREIPESARPIYGDSVEIETIVGPQEDCFSEAGMKTFLSSEYTINPTSDRMGYRMIGPKVEHRIGADIVSDGMMRGCVQVPASGELLVMMADGPTTGGYPKIATAISADLPLLAQCAPGAGRLRFRATTVAAAQAKYRAMLGRLMVLG